MKYKRIFPIAATALLFGCSDDGSSNAAPPTTVQILTISGAMHLLSGAYDSGCLGTATYSSTSGPHDVRATLSVSGINATYQIFYYTSSNGSCSGSVDKKLKSEDLITSTGSTGAISGWEDRNGAPVTAPVANNGTSVGNSVSYTALTNVEQIFYIDDVVSSTDPDGSPHSSGTDYLYFIADDTNGGSVRLWYNSCDVTGDTHCKAFPETFLVLTKM